ncbi:hypothetical protein MHYP_G00129970 [Metynnis hypsauchen]
MEVIGTPEFSDLDGSAQEQRTELHGMGFHGRAAASKPYITKRNAKRGMQWCKAPPLDSRAVETLGDMADFSPELPLRCGSESDSELSQSLARIKTRSYGSTASAAAPLGEKYVEHRVADGDTLQGIALKYGVTMEQIKRANKLFSNDCIFLRHSLSIPVRTERPSLFNGLSLESPDSESTTPQGSPCVSQSVEDVPQDPQDHPSPPDPDTRPLQPEELSAKDYLHMLDLQIKRSKQAARKLKEEDSRGEARAATPALTDPQRVEETLMMMMMIQSDGEASARLPNSLTDVGVHLLVHEVLQLGQCDSGGPKRREYDPPSKGALMRFDRWSGS